jgi:hypothetical protein
VRPSASPVSCMTRRVPTTEATQVSMPECAVPEAEPGPTRVHARKPAMNEARMKAATDSTVEDAVVSLFVR